MIAKIAVYIEVSWGFGGTEHDCSDLAGTLGAGAGGLCDGCHQTEENWGRRTGFRLASSTLSPIATSPLADVGFCGRLFACAMLETAMNIVLYYAPNACSLVPYVTL